MKRIMALDIPGLSLRILNDAANYPNIKRLMDNGVCRPLKPVLPAVTATMQATITTGLPPAQHGMIANGLFDRRRYSVDFWAQSHKLVEGKRIWENLRHMEPGAKTGVICFQNIMFADCDVFLTPAPVHTHGDKMISSCYTKPVGLYDELAAELGEFNLMHYWGPIAGLPSSQWIGRAAIKIWEKFGLNLLLTYLPHLDYCLQKFGPDAPQIQAELKALDSIVGDIMAAVGTSGEVVVFSEYGIVPVSGAVEINRALRRKGFIAVREVGGMEYLDLGMSRAFAMVDHQIAHVFFNDRDAIPQVKTVLEKTEGIADVLDEIGKKKWQLDHPNAAALVALAKKDRWFSYQWWLEQAKAPDFAYTVDIHRKPGYDPQELFFDPVNKCISQDSGLIKGSHGLVPEDKRDMALFIAPRKCVQLEDEVLPAVDIKTALLELIRD